MTTREKLERLADRLENMSFEDVEVGRLANIVSQLIDVVTEMEEGAARTANIASCLANGIQPD